MASPKFDSRTFLKKLLELHCNLFRFPFLRKLHHELKIM